MKKKLEKYGIKLACEVPAFEEPENHEIVRYEIDGNHYVISPYAILKTQDPIVDLELKHDKHKEDLIKRFMNEINDTDKNYIAYNLPGLQEIKDGIHQLVGRKLDRVVYSAGIEEFALDARFLRDIIYALSCTVCYVNEWKKRTSPLFFFENDDLESGAVCMLLPVVADKPVGFFVP